MRRRGTTTWWTILWNNSGTWTTVMRLRATSTFWRLKRPKIMLRLLVEMFYKQPLWSLTVWKGMILTSKLREWQRRIMTLKPHRKRKWWRHKWIYWQQMILLLLKHSRTISEKLPSKKISTIRLKWTSTNDLTTCTTKITWKERSHRQSLIAKSNSSSQRMKSSALSCPTLLITSFICAIK